MPRASVPLRLQRSEMRPQNISMSPSPSKRRGGDQAGRAEAGDADAVHHLAQDDGDVEPGRRQKRKPDGDQHHGDAEMHLASRRRAAGLEETGSCLLMLTPLMKRGDRS